MPDKRRLTKRSVDALSTADQDTFVWDADVPGFGMKLNRGGAKSYIVQTRLNGRAKRFTIGRHGRPWTPEMVRKRALAILGEVAQGIDPNEQRPERKDVGVGELMDHYFEEGCRT